MKKLINIAIAASLMAALTATSFAQGAGPAGGAKGGAQGQGQGKGPGGRRGGMMAMDAEVLAKLNLTESQKKDIKKLKEDTGKKMKDVFQDAKGGDREAMRDKMKGIFEGYQTGLKKILTPSQFAQFEKEMKEIRKKMGNRGPGGPGGAPPAGGKGKGKGGGL
jgi:periplasmic protein CpxP/Spy